MQDFIKNFPTDKVIEIGGSLGIALIVLIVGWIASKWAKRLVLRAGQKATLDEALARFLATIAMYVVLAATVIAALGRLGVQTTSLITIFASAGLAVGLALQGSLSNFAAGVMILFFRPIRLDDVVQVGGATGGVIDIGLFATTLRTPNNETIIVPNSSVLGNNITNYTTAGSRRANISIGVAYGTDVKDAMAAIERAINKADLVLSEPAPAVAFVGFGASSVDFLALPHCNATDYAGMQHNVRVAIYDELNAAGIEIPFDQIVVHQAAAA